MDSSKEPKTSAATEESTQEQRRVFDNKWLDDPLFKNWLEESPDGDEAFCTVCNAVLPCERSELLVHVQSQSHIDSYKKADLKIRMDTLRTEASAVFAKYDADSCALDHFMQLTSRLFYDLEIDNALANSYAKKEDHENDN